MTRPNDTQRMPSNDATDPSGAPTVKTEPGPARVTTQPLPIPIHAAPSAASTVDRRNATDPDLDPFLKAFDRTPVPPAPQTDERPSSDGGDFVSHYAMTKPAARNEADGPVPRVVVQRELRALIAEPSAEGAVVAPLDVSTQIPIARKLRRQHGVLIVAASLFAAVILIAAAVATRSSPPTPTVATGTMPPPPSAPIAAAPVASTSAHAPIAPSAMASAVPSARPSPPAPKPAPAAPTTKPQGAKTAEPSSADYVEH